MKYIRTLVIVLTVAWMPVSVCAQTSETSNQQLVDEVIETLALSHKVAQLPADFSKQFEQNPFRLSEEVNKKWLEAFNEAYSKAQLMQDYRTILKNKLSQLSADELSTWLNQTSTKKLAQARQEHYTLQGKRKQIVALYELEQDPAPQERQELIAAYAEAITPKGALIESSITVFQSIIKSIDQMSSRLNFTDAQISMIVNNFRSQGATRIKQLKEKRLPVMFYGVPSKTMEQSLNFWQSETGQALAEAIYTSLQRTYEKAGQRLQKAVEGRKLN